MVHRWLGDRIFDPRLWHPSRHEVAGGLALGAFVALTPTMGIQLLLAPLAAYFLRVNLPATILACWILNPITAPFIYGFELALGHWMESTLGWEDDTQAAGGVESTMRALWLGGIATAGAAAAGVYLTIRFAWSRISHHLPTPSGSSRDWRALRRAHLARQAEIEAEAKTDGVGRQAHRSHE